jgi:ankyrin repeat protein
MHIGGLHGDAAILKYMHKRGASVHVQKAEDLRTPLHMAAMYNTKEAVELLVKWGAQVDARALVGSSKQSGSICSVT